MGNKLVVKSLGFSSVSDDGEIAFFNVMPKNSDGVTNKIISIQVQWCAPGYNL